MNDADDEYIRDTEDVRKALEHHRREDECLGDVVERLLENQIDLMAGFGRWSEEEAERVRETRERRKAKSEARMEKLADESG